MKVRPISSSSSDTLYAATIGTPATASSSVEVPDLDSAARAVRKAASFAAGSVTIRAGTRQDAIAARTASLSRAGEIRRMTGGFGDAVARVAERVGAPPRRWAAYSRPARSADARQTCRADRPAVALPPVQMAAAPAHDRHKRAWRARVLAAKPTPRDTHSRRSGSPARGHAPVSYTHL